MPSHPPIPPNCPYFERIPGARKLDGWLFRFQNEGMDFTLCDIEGFYDGHEDWLKANRPIIAAVARCAWLDEELNRMKERRRLDSLDECRTNAHAWAKWGRGEDWQ